MWLEEVGTGRVFPLVRGRAIVVGRGPGADILTTSALISRCHCEVCWDGCHTRVRDLDSPGGTYINGQGRDGEPVVRPEGHLLRLGDVVRPGEVQLRLQTSSQVEAAWLDWNGGAVRKLARAIYEEDAFDRLPILADMLEEASCTQAEILSHLREPGEHVKGCWVLDLIRGKT
jgi:pSer/pThr/pTyr-binding forkhead associated (FHA) protein